MLLFIGLWLLAAPLSAQEGEPADWDARLTAVSGDVTVYTADEPAGLPATADMPLEAGDRLKTGDSSLAEISLEGGSVLSLRSHSDFTLTSPKRQDTVFTLVLGSLLAKIQKLSGGGLRVKTPTAVCAVRGTEFGVEVPAENPDETYVGVFDEGKVEVKNASTSGAGELLMINQETAVSKGAEPLVPYQLKRLMRHRSAARSLRGRASVLRKKWRALSPQDRQERRRALFGRMRDRREELRRKALDKPRERPALRKLRPDEEKMQKRKDEIRRRRRQ